MATIAPVDGPPEVVNARRTESLDAPHIVKLVREPTETLFGRVNVVNLIEKAVLAVTLCNDKDDILGHAAFFDYPNVADVDQSKWEPWLKNNYNCGDVTALNTLFMHYFVAKKDYALGCAREIIRTVFNAVPELHFLFLFVPMGSYPESALDDVFKQMEKKADGNGFNGALFVCHRHNHVPVLHVRKANVEDHDDLTPIFNKQSDMLSMTYGDFFLAELIEAQDEHMQCLVSEVEGKAVGFMSISDDVNYDLLNECFELGPFHGLRKAHPEDELTPPKTPTPPPQTPPQEERSASRASHTSDKSGKGDSAETVSDTTPKEGTEVSNEKSEEKKSGSQHSSARSSRANSTSAEESKVQPKLSDSALRESNASILADGAEADAEVAKEAEEKASSRVSSRKSSVKDEIASGLQTPTKELIPLAKPPKRFVPVYKGAPNAISVQLFCIDERYEMRSSDFLSKAFSLFPNCDFCVVTVPHLVPEFPLLQGFVRVTPRCPSILPQELYVFHRSGLLKDFHVRLACTKDTAGVEKLLQTIDMQENFLADLKQYNLARRDDTLTIVSNDGIELQAFVAECQDQIVGAAIVRREEDIEYIRSHYNIEDFIYFNHHKREEHGHLHHFALNPIFTHMSKYFIKEILRQGHKTCLYYPLYPPYTAPEILEKHSLVSALNDMVPVRARRQIVYPVEALGDNAPSERVLAEREPYALNHINRKLVMEPKVTINARIVVVGASNVGLAFLEALAYCPHLRFNNLTLISPRGLPGNMPHDKMREQMLGDTFCYGQDDMARISLRTWVNVVYGSMTAIDRKKKLVLVDDSTQVPFDHLVLCTGEQYQIPAPTEANISMGATNADLPNSPDRRYMNECPKNLFLVNNEYDAAVALIWIDKYFVKSTGQVIVYGGTLDAYCCVQTLLSKGVQGERIHLVIPPAYKTTCFNNPEVDNAINKALEERQVKVHQGYYLAQWNDGEVCTEVTSASFTSSKDPLQLDCVAFFAFYKKSVDTNAFKALNDACLVFDGKLVIDASFHTNDVSIRGAGTLTKYQRRYHAEQWTHANFNSKEVGNHLATEMLRLFDPTMEPQSAPPQEALNLIPIYRNPKVQGGLLPGEFYYLHVAKPGLEVPLATQKQQPDFGEEYITGSPGGEPDYFRIHINQYNNVETITCLSKKPIPSGNLLCLYGLHERSLNNLVSRFREKLIKDFYSYFRETWSLAMYHDRFAEFREEVRELLITTPGPGMESMEEKVRQLVDDDVGLNDAQVKQLIDYYAKSGSKRMVETRLLSFLSYNYYHLPMFAKPGMV